MGDLIFSHGGNIYGVKKRYKRDVLDFSANINPLGLSKEVRKEFNKSYKNILHYPDPQAKTLIKRIAHYWKIKKENILLGNGSCELIYLIISTFRPKQVLIPVPGFSEYERAARSIKAKIQFLKLKEKESFAFNLNHSSNSDILFIGNPNNPTGNLLLENQKVGNLSKEMIIVDEAFMDFLPDEKRHTLIWKATKNKKLIVLRTFTKFFALPGLRIGYLVAHPDLIRNLKQNLPPWNTNAFAQLLAEKSLDDKKYIRATRRLIDKERGFLFSEVLKIKGLKVYPSVTNFLLIKIENKRFNSTSLTKRLIERDILIRDCGNFRNLDNRFIRVAVRSHRENTKLIDSLEDITDYHRRW